MQKFFLLLAFLATALAEEPSTEVNTAIETFEKVSRIEQETRLIELQTQRAGLHARLMEIDGEVASIKSSSMKRIAAAKAELAEEDKESAEEGGAESVEEEVEDEDEMADEE